MQIVIDINEHLYKTIKTVGLVVEDEDAVAVSEAIMNGTPLPKCHGRLIDADALEGHSQIQIVPCGNGKYVEVMTYYQNDIDVAPTIIEADKGE